MGKDELKSTLSKLLRDEKNIQFAYLYGSFARGNTDNNSDVDIGVYVSAEVMKKNKFYPEQIAAKIEEVIKKPVDVRVLNFQSLIFLHQVLKYGELLINNNNQKRVMFETRVYDEYIEMKYYFDLYNIIRRKRLSS